MDTELLFINAMNAYMEMVERFMLEISKTNLLLEELVQKRLPRLLDHATLCKLLNISERTLYRQIAEYKIPTHRLGKRDYFYWEEVEQCLQKKRS